jgi:hypothetical protein
MRHLLGRFRQEGCKGPRIRFWRSFCVVAGELRLSAYLTLAGMAIFKVRRSNMNSLYE